MRVAFIGVSHWHLPLYLDPVLAMEDTPIVGVSDPDPAVAQRVSQRIGTSSWTDWRAMCDTLKPEFVFVLGRHCDMAEVCRHLLEHAIPFAVEKPAGIDLAEVTALARLAESTGVFSAVPFVFRQSQMIETLRDVAEGEESLYLSFTFVAGSVERYRNGSDWMMSRETSGGGCMINLGVHFLDLALLLLGPDVSVSGSMMSNALDGLDVEDHAAVLLRGGLGSCVIETGYIYPAPHMAFDMHFSIRTRRHHFAAKDGTGLQIISEGRLPRFQPMAMTNIAYYPVFVRDVLDRARNGRAPIAGLGEMARVMGLLETAYALSPLPTGRE